MIRSFKIVLLAATAAVTLSACQATTARTKNMELVKGPPVEDIVTPYDRALSCLRENVPEYQAVFAVAPIPDKSGKESYSDGGVGSFAPKDVGAVVQSALFKAVGNKIVNRTDVRPILQDLNWGIRDVTEQHPHDFNITGQVSSIDFIPGGGGELRVFNVGPGYRQFRILVTLDLALTESKSGRIVGNTALSKQVVAEEYEFGGTLFFGDTLVSLNVGEQQREALQFVLREMLELATYELLTQVLPEPEACRAEVDKVQGVSDDASA